MTTSSGLLAAEPVVDWAWVLDHLDEIGARTWEHIVLTGSAVAIGFAVAMVLSLVILRYRVTYVPITWFAGVLYTIPSLAAFVLLTRWFGLSRTSALIPLVTYTLLILIRNIVAGVDGVPPPVREAARGMGYPRWRRLVEVELPLALPVIIAGLRVATVTVIGLVAVAALIGEGGLGQMIFTGYRRPFTTMMTVGAGLSILLALAFDGLLLAVEWLLAPWARRRRSAP